MSGCGRVSEVREGLLLPSTTGCNGSIAGVGTSTIGHVQPFEIAAEFRDLSHHWRGYGRWHPTPNHRGFPRLAQVKPVSGLDYSRRRLEALDLLSLAGTRRMPTSGSKTTEGGATRV